MRPLGTVRSWPPDPMDELRQLFAAFNLRASRPAPVSDPGLLDTCTELDAWLADQRDYARPRKAEWASLIADFRRSLDARGTRIRRRSAALDAVGAALHELIGREPARRAALRRDLHVARDRLADPQAAVDAFDDLWDAVTDRASSERLVADLLEVLRSVYAFAGQSLSTVTNALTGIADDSAIEIAYARHELDGAKIPAEFTPPGAEQFSKEAELSADERLDLMRRTLTQPPAPEGQVVWVFYGHGRFDPWIFKLGPVSFFDGPVLLSVFEQLQEQDEMNTGGASDMWWYDDLPPEVVAGERAEFFRATHHWPDLEHWVAARVDLGPGPHLDPVADARHQADALVGLAMFHRNRGSWVPLTGYMHVIDEERHGGSWPIDEPRAWDTDWVTMDETDSWLVENQDDLEVHWPVQDAALAELVECISVLNMATRTTSREREAGVSAIAGTGVGGAVSGPVVFLQRVRVLELLASRLGVPGMEWSSLLEGYLMDVWVRAQLLDRVFSAVERAASDDDLSSNDPSLTELRGKLVTYGSGRRVTLHTDIALAALPDLAQRLPTHHQRARRVRDIAARVADVPALLGWVEELREEFRRKAGRAHRCRNSLTHGGPFHAASMETVSTFVEWQAGTATVVALRDVLAASTVADALTAKRDELDDWRDRLATADDVFSALVPGASPGTPPGAASQTP